LSTAEHHQVYCIIAKADSIPQLSSLNATNRVALTASVFSVCGPGVSLCQHGRTRSRRKSVNIPDDLTVPQFILDSTHPTRPIRKEGIPWLVDDTTGRQIGFEEVSRKIIGRAMSSSPRVRSLLKLVSRRSAVPSLRSQMLCVSN
jgi:hypothetical protein